MKTTLSFAFALSLVALVVACGAGPLEPGYTSCGQTVCSPGQYCFEPNSGMCTNGCTSDVNCQEGSVCEDIDDVIGEGTCSESAAPPKEETPPPPPPEDPLAACKAACDAFQGCGLGAADTAACRSDCDALTENQQIAVANCTDESCSSQPSCLGVDCFSDDHCGATEQCLDYTCL